MDVESVTFDGASTGRVFDLRDLNINELWLVIDIDEQEVEEKWGLVFLGV